MKKIELKKVEHSRKIGGVCEYIEPNITEDCMFYENGEAVGFYLSKMPEKMCKLADLANKEFQSDNVPKSMMDRLTSVKGHFKTKWDKTGTVADVSQMSVIIGSVPPKPLVRRLYPNKSQIHSKKTAQTFIKAMLLLALESEKLIKKYMPEQYEKQVELFKNVPKKWRFGNLFTSSISNYNISAPFHRDAGNIEGAVNVIICKQKNAKGGDLHIPDYNATIGQVDNSVLVYPAWRNVHGVTPIIPTFEGGYRNSLVFYPLKAFYGLE